MSSSSDEAVQDTLHIAEMNSDVIVTGTKYYVSGGDEGGLKGKLIRRTSKPFGTVSEQDWRNNFAAYWEAILDAPSAATGTDQEARDTAAAALTLAGDALPRMGGTMTGSLVLAADPTQPLEAATKGYVDALDATPAQAYSTVMKDATSNTLTDTWKALPLGDSPTVDQGTFTASGVDLTIGVAGQYLVAGQVSAVTSANSGSNRVRIENRAEVTRAADSTTFVGPIGSAYIRNQYTATQRNITAFSTVMTLGVGDKIQLQARAARQNTSDTVTIRSEDSAISVALVGGTVAGPKGDPGQNGEGLTDGSVTLDRLAAAVAARLLPAALGSAGQVLRVDSTGTGLEYATPSGGGLALTQVGQDTDHDYDIRGRMTDTTIDFPATEGLYGIQFTAGEKIHFWLRSGLLSKASTTGTDFAADGNSYSFPADNLGSGEVFYLGRNATTGRIRAGWRAASPNQVVTLYRLG